MSPTIDTTAIETLRGSITSVGFESGDQFVIGHWPVSPIGSFSDVMWRRADGSKALIATRTAADYITGIYPFDDHIDADVVITDDVGGPGRNRFEVRSEPLILPLTVGRLVIPFPPRPRWITATAEHRIAHALLGVNTHGLSPTGVEEWYRTRSVRRVVDAQAILEGSDLGPLRRLVEPMAVGFSDPPALPTHVRLRVDVRRRN